MDRAVWVGLLIALVVAVGGITAFKYVYADPDKNNVSVVCLFGHEYVFFSRSYRAGLAARFDDDGNVMVCDG